MPEIGVVGQNPELVTWGWQIAVYLFLGGLVAGLMIFGGVIRATNRGYFRRTLFVADLAALPLLGIGLLCLLLDLSNAANVWRLYTTFQARSAMSWGAWILLVAMLFLALRFLTIIPAPRPVKIFRTSFFALEPEDEEAETEGEPKPTRKPGFFVTAVEKTWTQLYRLAGWVNCRDRAFGLVGAGLGIAVGFYTGILLSTIPARPLWNTAVLAPLFLISGLASGGAFLCLFLPAEEHKRLVPFSLLSCGIEFLLLAAFILNLRFGNQANQRAGAILFGGGMGWVFWGVVILAGLVLPAVLEQLELMHRRLPLLPARVPPVLKLAGGLALRFLIVYAGLQSFV